MWDDRHRCWVRVGDQSTVHQGGAHWPPGLGPKCIDGQPFPDKGVYLSIWRGHAGDVWAEIGLGWEKRIASAAPDKDMPLGCIDAPVHAMLLAKVKEKANAAIQAMDDAVWRNEIWILPDCEAQDPSDDDPSYDGPENTIVSEIWKVLPWRSLRVAPFAYGAVRVANSIDGRLIFSPWPWPEGDTPVYTWLEAKFAEGLTIVPYSPTTIEQLASLVDEYATLKSRVNAVLRELSPMPVPSPERSQ